MAQSDYINFRWQENQVATLGILLAFIGIAVASYRVELMEIFFPEQVPNLLERTLNFLEGNAKSLKYRPVMNIAYGFGLAALLCGIIAILKKETPFIYLNTIGLSIIVLGWEYLFIAIALALLIAYISPLLELLFLFKKKKKNE